MAKYTEFGVRVFSELKRRGMTKEELSKQVTGMTGLYADGGYLYKIFTGQRNAPRIVAAINEILGIE